MSAEKAAAITWVKLLVGALMFCGMLYIHAYVKELNWLLFGVPGFLMGLDPSKFLGGFKK